MLKKLTERPEPAGPRHVPTERMLAKAKHENDMLIYRRKELDWREGDAPLVKPIEPEVLQYPAKVTKRKIFKDPAIKPEYSPLENMMNEAETKPDPAKVRQMKIQMLQKRIAREDMCMLRMEILELIDKERKSMKEMNARGKLLFTVLTQCMKMIDLWEEACESMEVLGSKNVFIGKRKDQLQETVSKRLGLEQDNATLRDTIKDLQIKYQDVLKQNRDREARHGKCKKDFLDEMNNGKDLNNKVVKARKGAKVLKEVMTEATDSLQEAFAGQCHDELEAQLKGMKATD